MTSIIPPPDTLAVFDVSGADIRFGLTPDGTPYAIASDFAKAMGYKQTKNALDLLDEDEKGFALTETLGGRQNLAVVFEDGLWELIFRSTLPGAKAIKARVKAILREIRETGRYIAEPMDALEIAERNVQLIKEKRAALARAEKAEAFQAAIEGGDGLTLRAFHKKYFSALTEKAFMDHLYARNYLINQRGKGGQRENGTFRDGSQHRHPSAKGKPFFYLHGHGEIGGARRENTRVRPGAPELELKVRLMKDGLAANNNDTGQPRAVEAGPARQVELEARR